ncbi:energy transducer TonB [Antarcticibacterium arcticum]|uniref:Energy transducer TonB n=1 Tax=Antarcticibacterium arcticum TaxID=2585771 RepID=A0A5B8YPD6_9FLAO|nr:energy transducer TonB [Antarcticibacterium arcticum]QED38146.1 energy transducer TonB [Antarcticibacterium arcticum]
MSFLDTKHEKKSFTITVIIHVLLIVLLLFLGLKYLDPPPESGIAINFGNSEVGSGDVQPTEPVKSAPQPTTNPVVSQPKPVVEEVVTQESVEAPVIEKKTEKKPVVNEKPVEPKKVEPAKQPDPTPSKSTTDALSSILNGPKSNGTATGGEGNDQAAGDKGSPDGDPSASSYYGNGMGLDGDGNYRLGGRRALNKERIVQDCNEAGLVVVQIEVNQSGQVTKATPGVKGTTNSAACLLDPAKRAALATRFNSDSKAPARQVGTIVYNFKLSE